MHFLGDAVVSGGQPEQSSEHAAVNGVDDKNRSVEVYGQSEMPEAHRGSHLATGNQQAYEAPPSPRREEEYSSDSANAESDLSENGPEMTKFAGEEPDLHGRSTLRGKRSDSYEPPELPIDEVGPAVERQGSETPSSIGRTATIKPRNGDRVSVYVPPPSPPQLNAAAGSEDETKNERQNSSRVLKGTPDSRSGITTVVIQPEEVPSKNTQTPTRDQARSGERHEANYARPGNSVVVVARARLSCIKS